MLKKTLQIPTKTTCLRLLNFWNKFKNYEIFTGKNLLLNRGYIRSQIILIYNK